MHASVRRLRIEGVLLAHAAEPIAGHLEVQRGQRLTLRGLMSAPGCNVLLEMHRPEVVRVDHDSITVRGVELGSAGGGVVAEWWVTPVL